MNASSLRILPAAIVLSLASIGLSATAQTTTTTEPTVTEKAKETGGAVVDKTKDTSKKAYNASARTTKKA